MINAPVTLVENRVSADVVQSTVSVPPATSENTAVSAEVSLIDGSVSGEVISETTNNAQSILVTRRVVTASVQAVSSTLNISIQTGSQGGGDMYRLIYDPLNKHANAFDAGNLVGHYDCGTFN